MSKQRLEQQLALNGGMKAVTRIAGKGQPKIGVDEFISVAERFGFSAAALAQFRSVAEADAPPLPVWSLAWVSRTWAEERALAEPEPCTRTVEVPVAAEEALA